LFFDRDIRRFGGWRLWRGGNWWGRGRFLQLRRGLLRQAAPEFGLHGGDGRLPIPADTPSERGQQGQMRHNGYAKGAPGAFGARREKI
jgi:hypothetical protein